VTPIIASLVASEKSTSASYKLGRHAARRRCG
jgi:hypothetical protein